MRSKFTFSENSDENGINKTSMSWRLVVFVILAAALTLFAQIGCVHASNVASESSVASSLLLQPPILSLPAGQLIQTKEGPYRPKTDEIWHSDARFRQLEQANLDLVAALKAKSP